MMKRTIQLFFALLFLIILLPLLSYALNPLHRDKDTIRLNLLKKTNIGLNKYEVQKIINSDLVLSTNDLMHGAPVRNAGEPYRTIGASHIKVKLGSHFSRGCDFCFIFRTYVYAYWAFDERNSLIDVIVYKETDAF